MADRTGFERRLLEQVDTIAAIGRAMGPRDRDDVDDLVQEVLLRAWANRGTLRDQAKLPHWVAIIARNTARELGRRSAPTPAGILPDEPSQAPSALESMQTAERWETLLRALDALDDTDRRLLIARYADEEPYADLQAEAGFTYAAVTTRIHRAKRRVRRALAHAVGSALALLVGTRPRAFGQSPAAIGGSRAMLSIIAAASAVFIAGVGLSSYRDTAGPGDTDDAAIVATVTAGTPAASESRDVAATLATISDASRAYEAALSSYSASFMMTKVYFPSRQRARRALEAAEQYMDGGTEPPTGYLDSLRAEVRDPSIGGKAIVTSGAFWEDGSVQAADWTEHWTPDGFEARRKAITDQEVAVETLYLDLDRPEPPRTGTGDRFRGEEFRLKRWSSFIGTPIAEFLAGEVGPLLSVAVVDEVVEGDVCYRIRAVRLHPGGAPNETDTIELLISAERGYLPLEILTEGPGIRTVTQAEIELHESGIWMPVGGRSCMYIGVDDEEELSAETSVQFLDIQRSVAIPETFAALPQPGSEERARVLQRLERQRERALQTEQRERERVLRRAE
ncbi:sigma-70 family RNA polymerase sigma factor [Candidatus Poribacteria bacterium]|jgi:RNA polymerase sigma factor (sigma-70 family)|nr:sigma-70 family RNA polymerase sigma factor [Candidatus Poribacteria bacterium]MBT5713590.1 sigma-70 family RNA polymerase sigma factor [Candidatus Poribacteria bacterium]MBT7095864.1 sigma-70 family RNA polymerase sigma factor [Candidatus Poribacteria bacterium]MBT7809211.1 sigma-70 family RNA polymerase sigma factor [Candidatus Poribacteria bacterium]